jgi:hypothetical protein
MRPALTRQPSRQPRGPASGSDVDEYAAATLDGKRRVGSRPKSASAKAAVALRLSVGNNAWMADKSKKRPDPHPESLAAIARRCQLLRIAVAGDEFGAQAAFAKRVGLGSTRQWNNFEREVGRLGLDAAMLLKRELGVSMHWLYFGERAGMPFDLMTRIDEAEQREADCSSATESPALGGASGRRVSL